ncbi:MAG TPA: hypothetical protein VM802_24550 [Chitinophaga sp.]|uniref:hypothetical protein n=1 Tax=Chitinophaga sp. TaxID=1869181 RepID=UPI002BCF6273|nr:hypothetical protein [Chitinophaga sp.]HVI48061.1 hypothetical protein [Chitinophaga sp.]
MEINPRKLFVIVGYPDSGKRITLHHLFKRKSFFPFKNPIQAIGLDNTKFVVVNVTNRRRRTELYLSQVRDVLQWHAFSSTSFMIMMSLILDDGIHDVRKMLEYLNESSFDLYYLILESNVKNKGLIQEHHLETFSSLVKKGYIYHFETLVTSSPPRLKQRADEVKQVIRDILREKKSKM